MSSSLEDASLQLVAVATRCNHRPGPGFNSNYRLRVSSSKGPQGEGSAFLRWYRHCIQGTSIYAHLEQSHHDLHGSLNGHIHRQSDEYMMAPDSSPITLDKIFYPWNSLRAYTSAHSFGPGDDDHLEKKMMMTAMTMLLTMMTTKKMVMVMVIAW